MPEKEVSCLCWLCSKEILKGDEHIVDDEIWCPECYESQFSDSDRIRFDDEYGD